MASMSYCRFENAYADIKACLNDLYEATDNDITIEQFIESRSSDYERKAVRQVYDLCQEFAEVFQNMEQF